MGLFDRFRSSEEEETKGPSLSSKARQDLRRARRAASAKSSELKKKGKRDVRRGKDLALEKAKNAELEDIRTAGNVDSPKTGKEVARKAGSAAQLRSPVDATIDPSPSGPEIEEFTRAGLSVSTGDQDDRDDSGSDGSVLSFGESENPLELDDSMGLVGGSSSDNSEDSMEDLL